MYSDKMVLYKKLHYENAAMVIHMNKNKEIGCIV